jgi:hypothetical protein
MEHLNAYSMEPATDEAHVETHWTRALHVDLYGGKRPRALRRAGIAFAAISVVVVVALTAFLEATVLAQVVAPEAAAADAVACHVPPPKPNNA